MLPPPSKQTQPSRPLTRRPDGTLYVATGATRTGKTTWTAARVAQASRLLVWDSADEWSQFRCHRVSSFRDLAELVKPGAPDRRVAFSVPVTADNFAFFCRLAWIYIRGKQGTVIVEELADVTSPGKAPVYWGELIRKGLRYGPELYALTQRPSESDKTVMGNASILHCHQMARAEDSRYMARELRVDQVLVDKLLPFHWIERDRRTKRLTNGLCAARRRK
jgi:hypothetical protein